MSTDSTDDFYMQHRGHEDPEAERRMAEYMGRTRECPSCSGSGVSNLGAGGRAQRCHSCAGDGRVLGSR